MFAQSQPIRLQSKAARGRFTGLAWSFADTPDRAGDLILPSALAAAVRKHSTAGTKPQVRIEHEAKAVAGSIERMDVTQRGLEVEGQLNMQSPFGRAAFEKLDSGEVDALSIGFMGRAEESGRSQIFTEVDLVEVSIVRFPMNGGARVSAVKSWGDVSSQIDLERLFRDHCGMTNRLAKKAASAAWPAINTHDEIETGLRSALARIINA